MDRPDWATGEAFCPYRVCPLGAHCDHQHGRVTGFALDKGVRLWYAPAADGSVELTSHNFDGEARFNLNHVPSKRGDWADPLRGAVSALEKKLSGGDCASAGRQALRCGVRGCFVGELPVGGLSSSAAVSVSLLMALCRVNEITLSPAELIDMAVRAESDYIGVKIGAMDPACELLCRHDALLHLDTETVSPEWIPTPPDMPPFDITIFYSGLSRKLANTGYNNRVKDMKLAALAMDAFAGRRAKPYADARLRSIAAQEWELYRDRLPKQWRKRAAHYFAEQERVADGCAAWRDGDMKRFGELISASGLSAIQNMEAGCEQMNRLYEIILDTPGAYGGRFSGAGFGGCCMAITDPHYREEIRERVTRHYLNAFPELIEEFAVFHCKTADGACAAASLNRISPVSDPR